MLAEGRGNRPSASSLLERSQRHHGAVDRLFDRSLVDGIVSGENLHAEEFPLHLSLQGTGPDGVAIRAGMEEPHDPRPDAEVPPTLRVDGVHQVPETEDSVELVELRISELSPPDSKIDPETPNVERRGCVEPPCSVHAPGADSDVRKPPIDGRLLLGHGLSRARSRSGNLGGRSGDLRNFRLRSRSDVLVGTGLAVRAIRLLDGDSIEKLVDDVVLLVLGKLHSPRRRE